MGFVIKRTDTADVFPFLARERVLRQYHFCRQGDQDKDKSVAAGEQNGLDIVWKRGEYRARVRQHVAMEKNTFHDVFLISADPYVLFEKKVPSLTLPQLVKKIIADSKETDLRTAVKAYRAAHLTRGWVLVGKAETPEEVEKMVKGLGFSPRPSQRHTGPTPS